MRRNLMTVRKKFLASMLATCIVLTPVARAQEKPENLFYRNLEGLIVMVIILTFVAARVYSPYAEGREAVDREKAIKDKEKLSDQEVSMDIYDDWFEMDGLSPNGDLDPMPGWITTKNNKSYKITHQSDSEGQDDFNNWIAAYIAANGSESAQVDTSSMKGKLKMGKDGTTVKFKMAIKYNGTTTSGDNFGGKAKGKMKFKGTVDVGDSID